MAQLFQGGRLSDIQARRRGCREPMGLALKIVDRPDRQFQVWAYSVSMGRLLLRSTKSEIFASRVDVLFQDVKALKLSTSFDGLVVTEARSVDKVRISAETGLVPSEIIVSFAIRAGSFDGYVVAGVCVASEDDREYFEPSSLWP